MFPFAKSVSIVRDVLKYCFGESNRKRTRKKSDYEQSDISARKFVSLLATFPIQGEQRDNEQRQKEHIVLDFHENGNISRIKIFFVGAGLPSFPMLATLLAFDSSRQ